MPNPEEVVKRLVRIEGYHPLFKIAFPKEKDPINYNNVDLAIGAFERLLATPARWDQYLAGQTGKPNPAKGHCRACFHHLCQKACRRES